MEKITKTRPLKLMFIKMSVFFYLHLFVLHFLLFVMPIPTIKSLMQNTLTLFHRSKCLDHHCYFIFIHILRVVRICRSNGRSVVLVSQ